MASALEPTVSMGATPPQGLATLTGVQILATGAYAPPNSVGNQDLVELGYDADWIVQRTGIQERRRASEDQATSDLAVLAAEHCLQQADISAEQLDLILIGTMTPDTPTPSMACHVQRRLGAKCAAVDLNAACAGFMYALVTGMQFIKTGCYRHVLAIGADVMSRVVDPKDQKTFPLFGDAAGAVLLGKGNDQQGLISYTLGADGEGGQLICLPGGGSRERLTPETLEEARQYIRMDGRPVFKWAVRFLTDTVLDVLRGTKLTPSDLDLVVFHQANMRIIDSAVNDLELDRKKVLVNLDRYGNTSAASIPLVLDEAYRQGRIRRGDHVLLCGFGAGLAWGTAVVRW